MKSDIAAGFSLSQRASAAAIFMGCTRIMYCAWVWPTTITATVATKAYDGAEAERAPEGVPRLLVLRAAGGARR